MNREIKFRAWTKRWGMVYPKQEFSIDVLNQSVWKDCCNEEFVELMQFTGLKDKNGREIYEGDILSYYDEEKLEVQWREDFGSFGGVISLEFSGYDTEDNEVWKSPENDCYRGMDELCDDGVEIIGNIFETPELLES